MNTTLTCDDVADYFLAQFNDDSGEVITNLKLQKLVYYAQGISLGLTGNPLFQENIEAWEHGPVVSALYQRFKDFGRDALPIMQLDFNRYSQNQLLLLAAVFSYFIQYNAWELRDMTHQEAPWRSAYVEGRNHTITQDSMRAFFRNSPYLAEVEARLFDFDLDRMRSRVEREFITMPDNIQTSDDIRNWLIQQARNLGE